MEIIIPVIVTAAALWYVIRHFKKLSNSEGCGCGCNCPEASGPDQDQERNTP